MMPEPLTAYLKFGPHEYEVPFEVAGTFNPSRIATQIAFEAKVIAKKIESDNA